MPGLPDTSLAARLRRWLPMLLPLVLLIAAALTYGTRYWTPQSLFWDENYHVASAQKHLDGVMYMEPHPPLGKMLIALGDAVVGQNADLDTARLLRTDHVSNADLPAGYSYAGVRLASVLCMVLAVLLFYDLLRILTGYRVVAAAFASLLVFDNALVVHARAAMLEGIQLFFALAAIWFLVRVICAARAIRLWHYVALGALIGLTVAVKLNGAVLLLLFVALYLADQARNLRDRHLQPALLRLTAAAPLGVLSLLLVLAGVFYIHIATATQIIGNRTYKASPEYIEHLHQGTTWTLSGFGTGLRDHWRYISEYADGVPRLDVCKPGENGSHVSSWPLGGKTINYRWHKNVMNGEARVQYTYLVANPVVWWSVLAGVLMSGALVLSRTVFAQRDVGAPAADPAARRLFGWMVLFTAMYVSYLLAILQIERVMYLYHYLLPLVFGAINLALVFAYVFREQLAAGRWHTRINLALYVALVAGVFAYFAPLTYGAPLTTEEFEQRAWFDGWRLQAVP